MSTEFSTVSIVLFIASGLLVFLLLFLFGKRQIMRFALKSARKPHVNIGTDAPKALRMKINECLESTQTLYYEPTLLSEQVQNAANANENHYHYRMKALDAFSNAVNTLQWSDSSVPRRENKQTIQLYLYCLCPSAAGSKEATIVEKFARSYVHARHSPAVFGEKEFIRYMELLDKVIRLIKLDQKRRSKHVQTKDIEVQMKSSKKTETVLYNRRTESIPLEEIAPSRREEPAEVQEHIGNREMSSGYSSTDRSSSGHGSVERLILHGEKRE